MANTSTFDFSQISFVIGGFAITGYADADDAITYSRRNDMWDLVVGADRDSVFVKKGDTSGVITLKLLPSSASNDILSSLALANENGVGVPLPVLYNDENGTTLLAGEKAMVMKMPDGAVGKNLTSNDWAILVADMTVFVGGMS
jgi:hypothetical protein